MSDTNGSGETPREEIILPGEAAGDNAAPDPEPAGASGEDFEGAVSVDEIGRRAMGFLFATALNAAMETLGRAAGADFRVIEVGIGSGPEGHRCLLDVLKAVPPEAYLGLYPQDSPRAAEIRARHSEYEFLPGSAAGDVAELSAALAVVDLSGGTWDLASAGAALRKLAPGGFLLAVVPGVEDPGGLALAEASVAAALASGFQHAKMAPLLGPGDETYVATALEYIGELPARERGISIRTLIEEVALRAERTGRAPFGSGVSARWRMVMAIKARGRVVVPPRGRLARP